MSLSLYNKYRPQTFKDVVGQEHVEKTLANAVEKGKVSHAYLFCGPRGTGKTTSARILAKALLCSKAPTVNPDGTCEQCSAISEGIHPDVYELDAASRTGVDNVREEIIGRVQFAPTQGSYKIYIIDEVHMLSTAAFNALLKTLEEPPSHVIFVLCTTDVHKVPDTVQARCQRFDFKHLAVSEIVGRLQYICEREGFDNEPAALELIAHRSQGGMRDAIRSLEQVAVFSSGSISYSASESLLGMVSTEQLFVLCDNLAASDAAECFNWVSGYVQSGSDIAILVNDLAAHVRNLYAVSVAQGADEQLAKALEIDVMDLPRLRKQAAEFGLPDRLAWMLTVLGSLSAELKNAANARLALETALVRMLRPESKSSLEALSVRISALEAQLANRGSVGNSENPERAKQSNSTVQSAVSESPTPAENQEDPILIEQQETAKQETPLADEPLDTSGSGTTNGDKQTLYRQWDNVIDAIKKNRPALAANLGGTTPLLSKDSKRLIVELPAGASTSCQYLEAGDNKELLHKTVEQIFGAPLEISFSVAVEEVPLQEPFLMEEQQKETPAVVAAPLEPAKPSVEPSKEELDAILSNSTGSTIQFEEQ